MKAVALRQSGDEIRLFLRIKHPHIDPTVISRELELDPEYANREGLSVSPSGTKRIHSESYWLAALPIRTVREMIAAWATFRGTEPITGADPAQSIRLGKPSARNLLKGVGFYDLQIIAWLEKLETRRDFLKKLIDENGSVTLVIQRPDRSEALTVGPTVCKLLAELGVALEID